MFNDLDGSPMPRIEIYTTPVCPYCLRAKRLLKEKQVDYEEIDLWSHPAKRGEMLSRANGRTTVPQIFIDGHGVGGCDDLYALDSAGKLDGLLRSSGRETIVGKAADA